MLQVVIDRGYYKWVVYLYKDSEPISKPYIYGNEHEAIRKTAQRVGISTNEFYKHFNGRYCYVTKLG